MLPSQWQHLHSQPPGAERSPPEPRRELPRGVEPPPPASPWTASGLPRPSGPGAVAAPWSNQRAGLGLPNLPPPATTVSVPRSGAGLSSGSRRDPREGRTWRPPGRGPLQPTPTPEALTGCKPRERPTAPRPPPGPGTVHVPAASAAAALRLPRRRGASPGPARPRLPPRPGTAPLPRPGPAGPLPIAPERVPEPPGRGSLSGGCRNGTRWMEFKLLLLLFLNSFSSAPPARPAKRADIQDSREIKL